MPIRPLVQQDKSQVLALDKIIFSTVDPSGGWRESDFNEFFNEESCYVQYDEEEPEVILGYVFAKQEENHTYISNLGSDPRSGKRGIGTALMEKVMLQEEKNAKKSKRPFSVKLHVDVENEKAIQFYKNLGFKEDGREQHGIKMTATQLPEKFQRHEKPRKALIIRNVEGMQYDDLKAALDGLQADEQSPAEFRQLIHLVRSNAFPSGEDITQALDLFKLAVVRDYMYETVKEKTGNHVIYHLNGLSDEGIVNDINAAYITEKLAKIPAHTDFDLLYLGGGHGSPIVGSSNLNRQQLVDITGTLANIGTHFSSVVLGSCFSAAFLNLYQPLLKEHGVTVSNSLECGGDNNFKPTIEWMNGKRKEFYSIDHIRNGISAQLETRTKLSQILEGSPPFNDELTMLSAYKETVRDVIGDLPEEETTVYATDLLNKDLYEFVIDIQSEPISKQRLQAQLRQYPKLDAQAKIIANKRGEDVFFNELIDCLKPLPTSLVIGTSKSLTMFDFSSSDDLPANAGDDFQVNYLDVRHQIRRSGSLEIIEVQDNFDDASVKKQFNVLFNQAIDLTDEREAQKHLEEQERLAREARERIEQEWLIQESRIAQTHAQNKHVFTEHLKLLKNKMTDLEQRGMEKAHQGASDLYNNLQDAGAIYFNNKPTPQSYSIFKESCDIYITAARKELDQHRGWSAFLTNLALGLGTLGVGLLIKGVYNLSNNRSFFFVHETASCQRVNEVEHAVEQVGPPAILSF